jgi:ABC-2 type transport system permease protein
MLAAPNTHFVMLSQAILYRGFGLVTIWPQLTWLTIIGGVLFFVAERRLRRTIGQMA